MYIYMYSSYSLYIVAQIVNTQIRYTTVQLII